MEKTARPMAYPLNTIFYGPPGTGKTYETVRRAAEIVTGTQIEDLDEAKEIFNENLHNRIEFITFHQNFSYEDFIQGLRPDVASQGEGLRFERVDGIFMRIATRALFEYYKKLKKRPKQENDTGASLNSALLNFFEYMKEKVGERFKTKTGTSELILKEVKEANVLIFKYPEGIHIYRVPLNKLKALYEAYPNLELIKNLYNDFRKIVGGDTTVYYVALREFIKFYDQYKEEVAAEGIGNDYEDLTDEDKKRLLSTVSLEELRSVAKDDVPKYVIIIDEINRANISRVFGELITLIEPDKRSHGDIPLEATLPSGERFIVPSNLYIIGTLNTADKSIALLDVALRRRFVFEAFYPDADKVPEAYRKIFEALNSQIKESKGPDFQIGHSYFMNVVDEDDFVGRMNNRVIPLLLEYFMNDQQTVKDLLNSAFEGTGYQLDESVYPMKVMRG